jgi:hypothetical protein
VEIYAALEDTVIPFEHAKALADQHPGARLHRLLGGHNNWIHHNQIRLTR